jgi:hypothetical protein
MSSQLSYKGCILSLFSFLWTATNHTTLNCLNFPILPFSSLVTFEQPNVLPTSCIGRCTTIMFSADNTISFPSHAHTSIRVKCNTKSLINPVIMSVIRQCRNPSESTSNCVCTTKHLIYYIQYSIINLLAMEEIMERPVLGWGSWEYAA